MTGPATETGTEHAHGVEHGHEGPPITKVTATTAGTRVTAITPRCSATRFWLTLALSVPVVALQRDVPGPARLRRRPVFPGSRWIPAGARHRDLLLRRAGRSSRARCRRSASRQPGMMLLIGLAITVAFAASWATELGAGRPRLLVGARRADRGHAARPLARDAGDRTGERRPRRPRGAPARRGRTVVTDGGCERCRPATLVRRRRRARPVRRTRAGRRRHRRRRRRARRVDDHRRVAAGAARPSATASSPAPSPPTRRSASASTAVGDETALAGIRRLVAEAQASRSRAQALADRAAALLFYVAASAAVATFVVWSVLGDTRSAIERTVTVLVIACPHALGLAIPLVIAISTSLSARARHPREGPARAGADAAGRRRAVRQDRHAHGRPARRDRRRRRRRRRGRAAARWPAPPRPTASTRSPARSSRPRAERRAGARPHRRSAR